MEELGKTVINVRLEGLSDIMFDRFIDYSKDQRPANQKVYLIGDNKLVFPSENLEAFLWGEYPVGCAKAFEGKRGKEYIRMGQGHVVVNPMSIPFLDENFHEITFDGFENGRFRIVKASGRVKNGSQSIKQEIKDRPVLNLPWFLDFKIEIIDNNLIDATKMNNWLMNGGVLVALGTWRPKYGRFTLKEFDVEDSKKKKSKK